MSYHPLAPWDRGDSVMTAATGEDPAPPLPPGRLLVSLVAVAIALGIFRRAFVGGDLPLWFDEIFSAVIAEKPTFGAFVTDCLHELSGPVYYGILWLWVKGAGIGNEALRFPSIVFSVVAPLVILRWGHPDRSVRMIWAAIIALLLPITYHADEARPYALIILFASCQTIALSGLLRRPSPKRALLWSSLSALLLLTHYYTIVVTGLQGLIILACRRDALRWQTFLPFVPVLTWASVHFATIIAFVRPGVSFYTRLPVSGLPVIPDGMIGTAPLGALLIAVIAGTSLWSLRSAELRSVRAAFDRWDVATAATGAVAVVIVTIAAMLHPCFSPRYLLPFLPSCMFGVALWANAWSRRIPACGAIIVAIFILLAGRETVNHAMGVPPGPYASLNFAAASRYIAAARPRRLIFFWGANASGAGLSLFNDVAGFELRRSGRPVAVSSLVLANADDDPNRALLAAASRPDDAILWIYDTSLVQGQLAIRYRARLSRIDPSWSCRNFGQKPIAVVACVRGS